MEYQLLKIMIDWAAKELTKPNNNETYNAYLRGFLENSRELIKFM